MTTVVEQGGELRPVNLENVGPDTARWLPWPQIGGCVPFDPGGGGIWAPGWWGGEYVALYEHQPEVRTCVDFLARNIAQIGKKCFRRIADDDREHLGDHPLEETLRDPNPLSSTGYSWAFALVADLAIFDEHYSAIAQDGDRLLLQRIPVPAVSPDPEETGPGPTETWVVRIGGDEKRVSAKRRSPCTGTTPAASIAGSRRSTRSRRCSARNPPRRSSGPATRAAVERRRRDRASDRGAQVERRRA